MFYFSKQFTKVNGLEKSNIVGQVVGPEIWGTGIRYQQRRLCVKSLVQTLNPHILSSPGSSGYLVHRFKFGSKVAAECALTSPGEMAKSDEYCVDIYTLCYTKCIVCICSPCCTSHTLMYCTRTAVGTLFPSLVTVVVAIESSFHDLLWQFSIFLQVFNYSLSIVYSHVVNYVTDCVKSWVDLWHTSIYFCIPP